jgi:hypothetical protein
VNLQFEAGATEVTLHYKSEHSRYPNLLDFVALRRVKNSPSRT